jgi:hypothetical protein
MVARIFLMLVLVLGCTWFNSIADLLHPTVASNLAVDQLQNDESSAITIRSYEYVMALLPILSWAFVALFGVFLFRNEIRKFAKDVARVEEKL